MILPDKSIKKAIEKGQLVVEPFDGKNLTPNGIDLSIEGEIRRGINNGEELLWTGNVDKRFTVAPLTAFRVQSKEWLELPANLVGMLELKTKYARAGIIPAFGKVDAGYKGKLSLTLFNGTEKHQQFQVGSTIVQISFILMEDSAEKLYSKRSGNYQNFNVQEKKAD